MLFVSRTRTTAFPSPMKGTSGSTPKEPEKRRRDGSSGVGRVFGTKQGREGKKGNGGAKPISRKPKQGKNRKKDRQSTWQRKEARRLTLNAPRGEQKKRGGLRQRGERGNQ